MQPSMASFLVFAFTICSPPAAVGLKLSASVTLRNSTDLHAKLATLEKEAKDDAASWHTVECLCKDYKEEAAAEIQRMQNAESQALAKIKSTNASTTLYGLEIEHLQQDMAKARTSLEELIIMRKKEQEENQATIKSLTVSVQQIKGALVVLGGDTSTTSATSSDAFVQGVKKSSYAQSSANAATQQAATAATVRQLLSANEPVMASLQALHHGHQVSFLTKVLGAAQQDPGYGSDYLRGVLQGMVEQFADDLQETEEKEAESKKTYQALSASRKEEIEIHETQIAAKTQKLKYSQGNSTSAEDTLKDAQATLATTQQTVVAYNSQCQLAEEHYNDRVAKRQAEIVSITNAIAEGSTTAETAELEAEGTIFDDEAHHEIESLEEALHEATNHTTTATTTTTTTTATAAASTS